MKKEHNVAQYEAIKAPINESSIDNDSNDGSIRTNDLEDIQDGNYVHFQKYLET